MVRPLLPRHAAWRPALAPATPAASPLGPRRVRQMRIDGAAMPPSASTPAFGPLHPGRAGRGPPINVPHLRILRVPQATFLYGGLLRELAHQQLADALGLTPGTQVAGLCWAGDWGSAPIGQRPSRRERHP
jgi:hypothetical protein